MNTNCYVDRTFRPAGKRPLYSHTQTFHQVVFVGHASLVTPIDFMLSNYNHYNCGVCQISDNFILTV